MESNALTDRETIGLNCIVASIYFLAMPTAIATISSGQSILKLLTIPIAAYFFVAVFFSKKNWKLHHLTLFTLLYTLTTVYSLFIMNDRESVKFEIGYILNTAIYFVITILPYNYKEKKVFEYVQVILLIWLSCMGAFGGAVEDDRTTLSLFGATCDPNYYCGFFILPAAVTVKKVVDAKGPFKLLYLGLLGFSLYALMLSGSRGGLLSVATAIFSGVLIFPKKPTTKFAVLIGSIAGLVLLWPLLVNLLPESTAGRFSLDMVKETGGTGRVGIWKAMLSHIFGTRLRFFFGNGIDAKFEMMGYMGTYEKAIVAHNHYIQLLYNQGLIGFLAFMLMMVSAIARSRRTFIQLVPAFLGMMVLICSLSINPSIKAFWNIFILAGMTFENEDPSESENKTVITVLNDKIKQLLDKIKKPALSPKKENEP